jgi:hypothetical protein
MSVTFHRYAVYGDCLASSIPFPELPASDAKVSRWTFETTRRLTPMVDAAELGADRIYGEVFARLHAHANGHRIVVDDTGSFELSRDRTHVTWEERAESWPDFVRAHLIGRVLATAIFLDGLLPLHASAVETRDGVIAFLAPKGFGKSTLALALSAAGARLVTDDTLPVEPSAAPHAWPGVHSLRVHDDALEAVGAARPALGTREGKRIVSELAPHQLMSRHAPLAAIYLLDPVLAGAGAVTRTALPAMLAAMGVVAHVKIGRMLGPAAAGPMLERAAAITRTVPVFRLHAPRDLAQLPQTATTILGWHGALTA